MGTGCSRDRQVSLMHFPAIANAFIMLVPIFQHYTRAATLSAPQNHMQKGTLDHFRPFSRHNISSAGELISAERQINIVCILLGTDNETPQFTLASVNLAEVLLG